MSPRQWLTFPATTLLLITLALSAVIRGIHEDDSPRARARVHLLRITIVGCNVLAAILLFASAFRTAR